jgi:solute carrier family 35 protein E1
MAAVGQEEEVDRKQTEASPTANETPVVLEKKPWPVAVWDAIRSVRVDFVLLAYLAVWYFGNFKSNISNKLALAGGTQECPFLVGTAEMLVGVLYALFLWGVPDARKLPKIKRSDVVALMPLTVCTLGHQFATVYATSAGSLSSVQILKATEPVFAAVFANFFYGKTVSRAKWLCLIPIIGGVALSSFNEISFSWLACGCVIISNIFSAVRSNEHRKAMDTEGLKDRLGSVGNQFAIVYCLCFLLGLPLSLLKEGHLVPHFLTTLAESPDTLGHIVSAGLWFYIYNEVSTMVVKRTGALTQSVLNTAKRVIVIVGASIVLGEGLAPMKILGCAIGIGGVFLYSAVGKFNPPADSKPKAAAAV